VQRYKELSYNQTLWDKTLVKVRKKEKKRQPFHKKSVTLQQKYCTRPPTMTFTTTLLQWFKANGRDLPWRQTRDPYAIWLSEIILQQTRTEQGRPYWERFMRRWPTVEQLAAATEDEVLREWQGLGYYSRARNLHTASRQVVAAGGWPHTIEGLRALKGVGDYTAAAIGSIAFDLPAAVVDGNVYRVLARYFGVATPINTTTGKKEFAALAQSLLPPAEASAYNQAIMDFGAIHCTPASPRCTSCPLAETCSAFRKGTTDTLPVKLKKLEVKERRLTYIYIRCKGQTALHRRPAGDIWQGLYEPLCLEASLVSTSRLEAFPPIGTDAHLTLLKENVRHVLTHRVLLADFWLWEAEDQPLLPEGYFWVDEDAVGNYGVPRLVEKLFQVVGSR
jgi:A/G-specific adenine glycosylase